MISLRSVSTLCVLLSPMLCDEREWGRPYWLYGAFSITSCNTSRFEFSCSNAIKNERIMSEMIRRNEKNLGVPLPFCSRDVANDQGKLVDMLYPLIEEGTMNFTGLCKDRTIRGMHDVKGAIVLSFATFELTQLASAILQPYDITLIAVTFRPMYPAVFVEHDLFVYSYEASFGKDLHQNGINAFRKELNITLMAVLNVEENNHRSNTSFVDKTQLNDAGCSNGNERAFCVYYEMGLKNGCIKEKSVNLHQIENVFGDFSTRNPRSSFIILYGSNNALSDFHSKMNEKLSKEQLKSLYFINFEVLGLSSNSTTYIQLNNRSEISTSRLTIRNYKVFFDIPGALAINKLMYFTHDFKYNFFEQDFIKRVWKYINPNLIKSALNISGDFPISPDLWKFLAKGVKEGLFNSLKYDKQVKGAQLSYWKNTFYVNLVKLKELYRHTEFSPGAALKAKPYCYLTKPNCSAGKELVHSYYQDPEWDTSYGWHCKLCKEGFYKNNNITKCLPCRDRLISREDRKSCYDPYKEVYLNIHDSKATILYLAFSGAMFLLIVFTFVVFYKNRETPLVKASNRPIAFLQIVTHAIMTVSNVLVFLGKPDGLRCIARPLSIGMLFTLTSAINFGKTQKVLLIFRAKLRMSRKEVVLAKASTLFTILSALVVDAIVLTMSVILDHPPKGDVTFYKSTYSKELHCSNNEDVLIQFVLIFVIVFCNAVQGVRARNVPSHYRESSYVTYSSFTSSVILIGATAIYASQVSEHAKTVTIWYTILLLNVIHFTLMYSYKIYVMLLKPEQNTRKAFDEKRKQRFNKSLISQTGETQGTHLSPANSVRRVKRDGDSTPDRFGSPANSFKRKGNTEETKILYG